MPSEQTELVEQVCQYIQSNLEELPTLEELGEQFHLSPYHLQRTFKKTMGITPRQYADACRVGKFKQTLRNGETVTNAIYQSGYGSSSRLYERSNHHLGMTPTTYQKGGKDTRITFSITPCSLGMILVAATDRGICNVMIDDDESFLISLVQKEYPKAEVKRDDGALETWVRAILSFLSGTEPHLDLPLDLRVTAFQKRVLEELCRIPYGETRSYSEIARAIGSPKAARAVGNACGANPVAVIIPCHRVVRSDGKIDGYHWGTERKKKLLDMEQEHAEEFAKEQL